MAFEVANCNGQDEGVDVLGRCATTRLEMVAVAGLGAGVDSTAMLGAPCGESVLRGLTSPGPVGTYRDIVEWQWWGRLNLGCTHVTSVRGTRAG